MDTATPTKQNVTDRELDPTKPQSTGNDKFKTQLSTETLTVVTINIEGFHGNQVYLQTLGNRADILLLQEHWLHTFEKQFLEIGLCCYFLCMEGRRIKLILVE
jgi:hypothetical protein